MHRIFIFVVAIMLTGCAGLPQPPVSVQLIPDDCANQESITRWLDQLARHPRSPLQHQRDHEQNISNIKARMWQLRYRCNPVR
jgi:hypothetical protein